MGKCQWRGYRGKGMSCIQGRADGKSIPNTKAKNRPNTYQGETKIVTDTSVQNGKSVGNDATCRF